MEAPILKSCYLCGKEKEFPAKEVRRKDRLGTRFFCSRACSVTQRNKERTFTDNEKRILVERSKGNTFAQKYTSEEKFFAETLRRVRARDKKKGFPETDLTIEYLRWLWDEQEGRCALSNIPMTKDDSDPITMASLDRGYSKRGYVQGNVQFVILPLNYAKAELFNNDIKRLIDLIKIHDKHVDTDRPTC